VIVAADSVAVRIVAATAEAMEQVQRGEARLPAGVDAAIAGYLEREKPGPGVWDPDEDTAPYQAMAREGVIWGYLFRMHVPGADAGAVGRVDDRVVAHLHALADAPVAVPQGVDWDTLEAHAKAAVQASHSVETTFVDWVDHGRAVRFGYLLGRVSRP
jgi:hypothetical protein